MQSTIQKASKVTGLTGLPLTAADLVSIHEPHVNYFQALWDSGKENELYRQAINLSDAQRQDIFNQGRNPVNIGIVADKLNRIVAAQRNNRTSFKVRAKNDPAKEINAELATLRLKDIESSSELKYTESEVFEGGVAVKYEAVKIVVDQDEAGNNLIRFEDKDYLDLVWDSNATTYTKKDGTFMSERRKVYRRDIRRDYGDEVADNIEVSEGLWGRQVKNYWGVMDKSGRKDDDIIILFEHYQKVLRDYYYVVFKGQVVAKERNKKDAEYIARMLKSPYLATMADVPIVKVQKKTTPAFDKYIFTYNEILEFEETELEDYPYCVYQAFHWKDKIWSMTDMLKSPAKFLDKLVSQIDYAFGSDIKNGWEIVEPWLAMGVSLDDAVQMIKDGVPVPVIHSNAVRAIPSRGANPQWMEMLEILKTFIEEQTGGNAFAGLEDKTNKTAAGKAMMIKQGELVTSLFMDNLVRWKRDLGKKTLWHMKMYDTAEYTMRILGGALSPQMIAILQENGIYSPSMVEPGSGFVKMNSHEMTYLKDCELDLIVTESELSESQREQRFAQLMAYNEMWPGVVTPDIALEFDDMEYSLKQRLIENYKQMMATQQQQLQDQKNLEVIKTFANKGPQQQNPEEKAKPKKAAAK